jgi:hypothetical protein
VVADYAWGRISLTDRLGVKNEFLSFGGTLRAQMTEATVLVDFSSHAPILRWSGHSQSTDPLAAEVGGFFARIKVPIDFVPGAEALVSKAAPRTLYCAFIQYVRERLAQAHLCATPTAGWRSGARARASAWSRRDRPLAGGGGTAPAARRDRGDRPRSSSTGRPSQSQRR